MSRQHDVVRRGGRKFLGLVLGVAALFFVFTRPVESAEHVLAAVRAIATFFRSL